MSTPTENVGITWSNKEGSSIIILSDVLADVSLRQFAVIDFGESFRRGEMEFSRDAALVAVAGKMTKGQGKATTVVGVWETGSGLQLWLKEFPVDAGVSSLTAPHFDGNATQLYVYGNKENDLMIFKLDARSGSALASFSLAPTLSTDLCDDIDEYVKQVPDSLQSRIILAWHEDACVEDIGVGNVEMLSNIDPTYEYFMTKACPTHALVAMCNIFGGALYDYVKKEVILTVEDWLALFSSAHEGEEYSPQVEFGVTSNDEVLLLVKGPYGSEAEIVCVNVNQGVVVFTSCEASSHSSCPFFSPLRSSFLFSDIDNVKELDANTGALIQVAPRAAQRVPLYPPRAGVILM